jgi:hypothetical protein
MLTPCRLLHGTPMLPGQATDLQCDLAHIWLCCYDLILWQQLHIALVLEIADGSAEVQVAIDAAHPTNLTQEATCATPQQQKQKQRQQQQQEDARYCDDGTHNE